MEDLKELKEAIKKELKEVGTKGITSSNLESTSKLVDMLKDLAEAESMEGMDSQHRESYNMSRPQYMMSPSYNEPGGYSNQGYGGNYATRDYPARGGRSYNGYDQRMRDRIDRVIDGAEIYEYGRDRYQHGGSHESMEEGLEKMMYAVCMLVETAMDAAQSPREKEIIRKHIQKIKNL